MIRQYRKKPVVIEAVRFDGSSTGVGEIRRWMETGVYKRSGVRTMDLGREIVIHTLEGDIVASMGDYIIKGVQGEFYPCKPDIFEQTYESVPSYDIMMKSRETGKFELNKPAK